MKQPIKIYLEKEDIIKLKAKAGNNRGSISLYIQRIAREDICFLDNNVKTLLKALDLQ